MGLAGEGPEALRPCDGGTLELSGPFGGKPSLASNSAKRAFSATFSETSASMRATSVAISASLSIGAGRGEVTHRLTHTQPHRARADRQPESIYRSRSPAAEG